MDNQIKVFMIAEDCPITDDVGEQTTNTIVYSALGGWLRKDAAQKECDELNERRTEEEGKCYVLQIHLN